MVRVTIITGEGLLRGFKITGHSGAGIEGEDIVCAAVSSAAYMAANTVTDILRIKTKPEISKASMKLRLKKEEALKARDILKGFELHIRSLEKDYPDNIKVIYGGVKND